MKFLRYLTFAFYILSLGANAQDDSEEIVDLSAVQWLSGKWEGSGYTDPNYNQISSYKQIIVQNFELSMLTG